MAYVAEWILVSILSVSVDPNEMFWAEAATIHSALCGHLNLDDLMRPFLLIWVLKMISLRSTSIISLVV